MKKAVFIFGTRPEYQRIERVSREMVSLNIDHSLVYIPQKVDKSFINYLQKNNTHLSLFLKKPKENLFYFAHQICTDLLNKQENKIVITSGDTTVATVASLVAYQKNKPSVKIGAGMRRDNFNLPEEKNDIMSDYLSDTCFCFSQTSVTNLLTEHTSPKKIVLSGTTLISEIHININDMNKYVDIKTGIIVSIHRKETILNKKNLWILLRELAKRNCSVSVIIHQDQYDIKLPRSKYIKKIKPVDHTSFLNIISSSRLVITDSQTIQEESCFLHTPCITILNNTNRPETVELGYNYLLKDFATLDSKKLKHEINYFIATIFNKKKILWKFPFGDPEKSFKIIIDTIRKKYRL